MDPDDHDLEAGPRHGRLILVVALISAIVLAFGGRALYLESTTPGPVAPAPAHWPTASAIHRTPGKSTLVVFVHPHCPCSRATLSELDAIVEPRAALVDAWVVFLRPPSTQEGWEKTDTWTTAEHIPGTRRLVDDGSEAARFGALTSGHVVLYDADGRLAFRGGITDSRGHAGRNVGRDTVAALVDQRTGEPHDHPVYGCLLGEASHAP